jgi:hypothetical protein
MGAHELYYYGMEIKGSKE